MSEWLSAVVLPLALIACAGCGPGEDYGSRLRRECESAVREFSAGPQTVDPSSRDALVQRCIGIRAGLLRP